MFALCIEASHQKGLGHLFRALNFIDYLNSKDEPSVVFVNNDKPACAILKSQNVRFETVDVLDHKSDWETGLIRRFTVDAATTAPVFPAEIKAS